MKIGSYHNRVILTTTGTFKRHWESLPAMVCLTTFGFMDPVPMCVCVGGGGVPPHTHTTKQFLNTSDAGVLVRGVEE